MSDREEFMQMWMNDLRAREQELDDTATDEQESKLAAEWFEFSHELMKNHPKYKRPPQ